MGCAKFVTCIIWFSLVIGGSCSSLDECYAEEGQNYTIICEGETTTESSLIFWETIKADETEPTELADCDECEECYHHNISEPYEASVEHSGRKYSSNLVISEVTADMRHQVFECAVYDVELRTAFVAKLCSLTVFYYDPTWVDCQHHKLSNEAGVRISCSAAKVYPGIKCLVYQESVQSKNSAKETEVKPEYISYAKSEYFSDNVQYFNASCSADIYPSHPGKYGFRVEVFPHVGDLEAVIKYEKKFETVDLPSAAPSYAEARDAERRDAERRDAERRDAERRNAETRDTASTTTTSRTYVYLLTGMVSIVIIIVSVFAIWLMRKRQPWCNMCEALIHNWFNARSESHIYNSIQTASGTSPKVLSWPDGGSEGVSLNGTEYVSEDWDDSEGSFSAGMPSSPVLDRRSGMQQPLPPRSHVRMSTRNRSNNRAATTLSVVRNGDSHLTDNSPMLDRTSGIQQPLPPRSHVRMSTRNHSNNRAANTLSVVRNGDSRLTDNSPMLDRTSGIQQPLPPRSHVKMSTRNHSNNRAAKTLSVVRNGESRLTDRASRSRPDRHARLNDRSNKLHHNTARAIMEVGTLGKNMTGRRSRFRAPSSGSSVYRNSMVEHNTAHAFSHAENVDEDTRDRLLSRRLPSSPTRFDAITENVTNSSDDDYIIPNSNSDDSDSNCENNVILYPRRAEYIIPNSNSENSDSLSENSDFKSENEITPISSRDDFIIPNLIALNSSSEDPDSGD